MRPAPLRFAAAALAAADAAAGETAPSGPIRLATPGHLSPEGAKDLLALIAARHPGRRITVQSDAARMQYGLVPSNAVV